MGLATGPIKAAPKTPAPAVPAFNMVDYIRRLRQASVEVQRIRGDATALGVDATRDALQMLSGLVSHGMVQARMVTPQADRDEFVDQMRKIIASSGMPLAGKPPDAESAKAPGMLTEKSVEEMFFPDRLPRFMKKWKEGDPEWRLLQCAVRMVDDQTFVIGMAETSQQHYSVFHGVSGGDYKAKDMALPDAQKMLTVAYRRGYMPISVKTFSLTVGPTKEVVRDYAVVRMTNGSCPAATPSRCQ